jgi:hypothetical protein
LAWWLQPRLAWQICQRRLAWQIWKQPLLAWKLRQQRLQQRLQPAWERL